MIRRPSLAGAVLRGSLVLFGFAFFGAHARAQSLFPAGDPRLFSETEQECQWLDPLEPTAGILQEPQSTPADPQRKHPWKYGGFVDLGYLLDFNHPSNHLFRNRSTTPRVNELDVNMAALYLSKDASADSRWGIELEAQAGEDSKAFGFSATAPNLADANWLRQIGKADVSYLLPIGNGLTVQGGIFSSVIGYDSLYAKDNFNYTRPWGADNTPYLMMGVNVSYPFNKKITATAFVINSYSHLAHPNTVPSWGGQVAYSATERFTLKETTLIGPQQSDTAFEFWRFFSDTTAEWKRNPLTIAFEYQVGTEEVATGGSPRALWMAAQLPVHWAVHGPWSVTLRPEFAWDRDGRWTGFPQTIKAVTSTLEYRHAYRNTNTIVRIEHRYDDSRGKGGGFFYGAPVLPGVDGLTPTQQLLLAGVIFTFDSR